MNDYERVAAVIRHLDENHAEQPSLGDLAAASGLSESHFHRLFHRWAGITPKDFLQSLTLEHAKRRLRESASVLDAALDAGLSGPGRLHDLLVSIEAASPGEFKSGGEGMSIEWGVAESPFGACSIGWNARGICHLAFQEALEDFSPNSETEFRTSVVAQASKPTVSQVSKLAGRGSFRARRHGDSLPTWKSATQQVWKPALPTRTGPASEFGFGKPAELRKNWPNAELLRNDREARRQAKMIFNSKTPSATTLKAFVRATPFQLKVWRALLQIPEGCVASYRGIAEAIENPKAVRAVGTACGSNPVAYLIPCHRVIRETGAVQGYRWGTTRKRALLAWEATTSLRVSA